MPKIVNILVEFSRKIEATLVEMRKLLPGPQPKPFRLPIPSPMGLLPMNRALVELRIPQHHHLHKEPVFEVKKVATLALVVQVKAKVVEKESETPKTKSFNPSLRRISTKKKKEPTPESSMETEEEGSSEDVEEVEVKDSSEELESEEEKELETPLPKKTKIKTRTSERHKATPVFKTPVSTKRPAKEKTLKKGESS